MKRQLVCDSSAVVAMLLDSGADGVTAARVLADARLASPSLMNFEVANIIRRHELATLIGSDQAAQAHADLGDLSVELWPHAPLAARAWELRHTLTIYDASYVALAELLDAPLVTLDQRIARTSGVRCAVEVL